jgi:hypothetical protein
MTHLLRMKPAGKMRNTNIERQADLLKRIGLLLDVLNEHKFDVRISSIENKQGISLLLIITENECTE